MINVNPDFPIRDASQNTFKFVPTCLQRKVSEVAKSCFQLLEKLFSWIASPFSRWLNKPDAAASQENPASSKETWFVTPPPSDSFGEPLSAWRFPITEAKSISLPPVPFILADEQVLVSPKGFQLLLKHSDFLQKLVQGAAPGEEEKQEMYNPLAVGKRAVDLREFGEFTKQHLEQALETLETKRITKQAIEGGGTALLESLALTEETVFTLEDALRKGEFYTEGSIFSRICFFQKTKESQVLTYLNVQISLKNLTLKNLTHLLHFPNIRKLELDNSKIQDFSAIKAFKNLEELHLEKLSLSNAKISDIFSFLQELPKFKTLTICHLSIRDFSAIRVLQNLEKLDLSLTDISDISFLRELQKLKSLRLFSCRQLRDISAIETLKNLEELSLSYCSNITNFSAIRALKNLKEFEVLEERRSTQGISDISFLRELPNLKSLSFFSCKQIQDFTPIRFLKNLESLDLAFTNISNICFLSELPKLTVLALNSCKQIQDFSVIDTLQNLKQLDLEGTAGAHLYCDLGNRA